VPVPVEVSGHCVVIRAFRGNGGRKTRGKLQIQSEGADVAFKRIVATKMLISTYIPIGRPAYEASEFFLDELP
jgi:hypothetical protein